VVGERESIAGESSRSERSSRRVVGGLRAGYSASGNAAVGLAREDGFGRSRGAPSRLAVHRGPAEGSERTGACLPAGFQTEAPWAAPNHRRAACILAELVDGAAAASPNASPALRFGGCGGQAGFRQPVGLPESLVLAWQAK